jgi:hypothetical protein
MVRAWRQFNECRHAVLETLARLLEVESRRRGDNRCIGPLDRVD